jgi:WD40 repeat protein
MPARKLHWLDIGEWVALAIAALGLASAIITGTASWPLLLLAAALMAALICNGINRLRWQRFNRKRIKQFQHQLSEEMQAIKDGDRASSEPVIPATSSDSDGEQSATLSANLAALEQSLDTVVHYLREQAFPDRVARLEAACAQLQQEIHQLSGSLPVPPPPAPVTAPTETLPLRQEGQILETKGSIMNWQCRHILTDHGAAVPSLAIAPNGRWLASASWDQSLKLWELESGKLLASLVGHAQGLLAIAFLGQEGLATGSFDQSIKLWSLLPAGEGAGREIKLEEILTAHTGSVHALAAIPDLHLLVSGSYDQTVKQWDWKRGKLVCSSYDPSGAIYAVAVSTTTQLVASGGGDGRVALWRLGKGDRVGILAGNISSVECLAIAPDGEVVAAGCVDGSVKVWRPSQESNRPLQSIAAHTGQVKSLAFTADGQFLVSGGADGQVRF